MIALLCGLAIFGPTVVSAQKITVTVASTFPPDSPQDKGLNKFKQLVTERSGGLA
jgi:TRAP-type C4-dicarboxylate transport system substrate-binding protein